MLYFDPRLSSTGTISCFSCHNVMEGGDDHRPTSIGVHGHVGGRNAPTVWNAAFLSSQFWDGRAATLEDQAKGPPANSIEMGMANLDAVIDRIRKIPGYKPYFEKAFGAGDVITMDNAAKAIAAYERTLITPNNAYDLYAKGDTKALTAQQARGLATFAEVGCTTCHQGPTFSGPALPVGTGFFMKFPTYPDSPYVAKYDFLSDTGRASVTKNDADKNVWRVPGLRNLTYTAPYFHNGQVHTIDEAVRIMASTQLNKTLSDSQVADIVAVPRSPLRPVPDAANAAATADAGRPHRLILTSRSNCSGRGRFRTTAGSVLVVLFEVANGLSMSRIGSAQRATYAPKRAVFRGSKGQL